MRPLLAQECLSPHWPRTILKDHVHLSLSAVWGFFSFTGTGKGKPSCHILVPAESFVTLQSWEWAPSCFRKCVGQYDRAACLNTWGSPLPPWPQWIPSWDPVPVLLPRNQSLFPWSGELDPLTPGAFPGSEPLWCLHSTCFWLRVGYAGSSTSWYGVGVAPCLSAAPDLNQQFSYFSDYVPISI